MQKVVSMIGRRLAAFVRAAAPLAALCGLAGCGPGPQKAITNPDPSGKIPAMKEAVRVHDLRAAPQLVKDLESDDGAVRFYAIEALQRLTGETFGYVYYQDEEHARTRAEKVEGLARSPAAGNPLVAEFKFARPGMTPRPRSNPPMSGRLPFHAAGPHPRGRRTPTPGRVAPGSAGRPGGAGGGEAGRRGLRRPGRVRPQGGGGRRALRE